MSMKNKLFDYSNADTFLAEKILRESFDSWLEQCKPRRDETEGELLDRIYSTFEALLLVEVVNACVPYTILSHKEECTEKMSLKDKQVYLKTLMCPNDMKGWHRGVKFMNQEVKGSRTIRRLKTKNGDNLKTYEEISKYLNEKYTERTHVPDQLKKHIVQRPEKALVFKMSEELIVEKLKTLSLNKSSGPSDITNEMLMLAPDALAPYLHFLYSKCLEFGELPKEWLHSQVVPAYKGKGKRSDEDSYRPISISPVVGKLLEHIVAEYLSTMLDVESVLHHRQHGHRKGYSNESQLACFVEELSHFTRKGAQVDCIKLDLKSATSFVSHKILLDKLKCLPIDEVVYAFLRRFLKSHTQSVKVGSCTSSRLEMKQGMPQGSPLTNPLFLIYIDDIFNCPTNRSTIRGFGDDILIYKMVETKFDQYDLQEDTYLLQEYIKGHGLKANFKKIEMVTFINPNIFLPGSYLKREYLMFDQKVAKSKTLEYLGVTISERLHFQDHVKGLIKRFEPEFEAFMQMMKLCSDEAKKALYLSTLRSKLEMCSSIWNLRPDYTEDALIASLERLQQNYAAYVLNIKFYPESWHPSWKKNLEALGWEPLFARRLNFRLQLAVKFMQRTQCLLELAHMQHKLTEQGEYKLMRKDNTSLLAVCKNEWRRMRTYFKNNPFRDFDVDESCLHCADVYCSNAAKSYDQKRTEWVEKWEQLDPEVAAALSKKYPHGIQGLAKFPKLS